MVTQASKNFYSLNISIVHVDIDAWNDRPIHIY